MTRFVLHLDLDAFFASVEELDHPEWRGEALIVGADPQQGRSRGVVLTANYEARKFGVKSAMPISEAWRRAPHARYAPPRHARYREKSDEVFRILRETSDALEPASVDEAYLDLSGRVSTFPEAMEAARALQARILAETGLSASLGVASSKLVAKIASDLRKPRGLTGVPPGTEEEFLAPLPVRKIPGVGPKTDARLAEMGITTCAELALTAASLLATEFGAWGPRLAQLARGIDASPVATEWQRKSLGSETTFGEDEEDPAAWDATLRALADEIAASLREEGLLARTFTVKVRLSGFETHTRARTLARPTSEPRLIAETAVGLLREFAPPRAVRLLGLRATSLETMDGRTVQRTLSDWPVDILGEAASWRPAQRRLDEVL